MAILCLTRFSHCDTHKRVPSGSAVRNLPANSGDAGSIPGSGRSPGEGTGYPLQYSCLRSLVGYSPWGHKVGHDWMTNKSPVIFPKLWSFSQTLKSQNWKYPQKVASIPIPTPVWGMPKWSAENLFFKNFSKLGISPLTLNEILECFEYFLLAYTSAFLGFPGG